LYLKQQVEGKMYSTIENTIFELKIDILKYSAGSFVNIYKVIKKKTNQSRRCKLLVMFSISAKFTDVSCNCEQQLSQNKL
jgi:hypothetical protein